MGASQHKQTDSPRSQPMSYQDTTPLKDHCPQKRQLAFDPRSPSDEITRTPILVEKTPSSLHHLDPRSPTEGVERTPMSILISKGLAAKQDIEMEVETTPNLASGLLAPLCAPEETDDMDMTTPTKPYSEDAADVDTEDFSPLLTNELKPSSNTAPVEPTPVPTRPASQPKQLFPASQLPQAAIKQFPGVRSPLGLVARPVNSPRTMVQTKQRRQVSKALGTGGRQYSSIVDKENMAH